MESRIKIFETGKKDGIISRNKKFYPENFSEQEINQQFLIVREKLGEKYGFDGKKYPADPARCGHLPGIVQDRSRDGRLA